MVRMAHPSVPYLELLDATERRFQRVQKTG